MVLLAIVIAAIVVVLSMWNPINIARSPFFCFIDANLLTYDSINFESLQPVIIAQIAALLAICVTVFVFLFTELNSRAQDRPGERIICGGLQKDFALRVERLSIQSIVLITLNYWEEPIYNLSCQGINYGHALFGLLMAASFISSAGMIVYCIDVAQYQRHLKWRAWDLTRKRYDSLLKSWSELDDTDEVSSTTSSFWTEYRNIDLLVQKIVDSSSEMTLETIERFKEITVLGNRQLDKKVIEVLKTLYKYQTALDVYQTYDVGEQEEAEKDYPHTRFFAKKLIELTDWALDQANRLNRIKSNMNEEGTPGINDSGPLYAYQITRGLWQRLIRGGNDYFPMKSQRLHDMALTGLDFSGGSMGGTSFFDCRLVRASFEDAMLDGAAFINCDLRGVLFLHASSKGLYFSSCNLGRTHISSTPDRSLDKNEALLSPCEGMNLANVSFAECSMPHSFIGEKEGPEKLGLTGTSFLGCDLSSSEFRHAKLDYCALGKLQAVNIKLIDCVGESVDLSDSQFINAIFRQCNLERSNVSRCLFSHAAIEKDVFPYLDATDTVFENAMISDVAFDHTSFINARVLYTTLSNVKIQDSNLTSANMLGSGFNNCLFERPIGNSCQLSYTTMSGTKLLNAKMKAANLLYSKLRDCEIRKSSLDGVLLREAQFINTTFEDVRMSDADCSDVLFKDLSMARVIVPHAIFDRAKLIKIQVEDSMMYGTSFRCATLQDCVFLACLWEGADFTDAILNNCSFALKTTADCDGLLNALSEAKVLNNVTVDGKRVER